MFFLKLSSEASQCGVVVTPLSQGLLEKGYWDAIHVVEVRPDTRGSDDDDKASDAKSALRHQYRYKLTSTVMLYLSTTAGAATSASAGARSLAGSVTRQVEQRCGVSASGAAREQLSHEHVVSVGRMIEEMEAKLRNSLDDVYFKKTREVVEHLRASDDVMRLQTRQSLVAGLMNEMVLKKNKMAAAATAAEEER